MAIGLILWSQSFDAASTRVTDPAEILLRLSAQLPTGAELPETAVSTDIKTISSERISDSPASLRGKSMAEAWHTISVTSSWLAASRAGYHFAVTYMGA